MNFSLLNTTLHFIVLGIILFSNECNSLDFRFRVDDSHLLVGTKDGDEKIEILLDNKNNTGANGIRGKNFDDFDKLSTKTFPEYLKKHFKSKVNFNKDLMFFKLSHMKNFQTLSSLYSRTIMKNCSITTTNFQINA